MKNNLMKARFAGVMIGTAIFTAAGLGYANAVPIHLANTDETTITSGDSTTSSTDTTLADTTSTSEDSTSTSIDTSTTQADPLVTTSSTVWKNHGEYVSWVAHHTPKGKGHGKAVSEAARSDIGKKSSDTSDTESETETETEAND
jgi:hypothetical protein